MSWQGSDGAAGDPGRDPSQDETRTDLDAVGTPPTPDPGAAPDASGPIPSTPPPPTAAPPPAPPPAGPPPGYGAPPPVYPVPPLAPGSSAPGQPAPVAWAPPEATAAPTGLEVPGAPGLIFGSVLHRVLAYWIDAIIVGIAAGILAGITGALAGGTLANLITTVVFLGAEFLYFVGFWTSESRATPGMRLMKLQIGQAFDGRTLTIQQAVIRWVALGLPFQSLGYVPELAGIAALTGLWALVLLVSTGISPTRQGIHDRLANSAIVQPAGASTPAVACLVLVLIFILLPLLAIIALIFLGTQVSEILTEVGTSVTP